MQQADEATQGEPHRANVIAEEAARRANESDPERTAPRQPLPIRSARPAPFQAPCRTHGR